MNEQTIFTAVLDLDPTERDAFLADACENNYPLRERVEKLLQYHAAAGDFLNRPGGAIGLTIDQSIAEQPGVVIGPYKLLEQIGEGGFGVVFMAEQQRPIRRRVALKVIKPGMDTRQVIARFEAERQALALMDHPNIARVLDAGTTGEVGGRRSEVSAEEDGGRRSGVSEGKAAFAPTPDLRPLASTSGRPYFVMELVRGIPLNEFCDQNRLTVGKRLELFITVCHAIQHAHQKGIIHRDIKPNNVLVTLHDGTPVAKVIDFGVAKATGQQLTDKTLFTSFAQMIGTPLYMSPEQAEMSGLDVDTRSDIYSLGVLLYELLTGTTPFDQERMRTAGYDEVRRIICEEEPAKPSARISTLNRAATTVSANRRSDPIRLRQLFRGELDWIVMKALEKDRNRRYETAAAFAADVQRYLDDEAVEACPPSARYRFRKFARRNRAALLTGAAIAVAVLVAVGSLISGVLVLAASNAQVKEEQKQTQQALEREKETSYSQRVALAGRELAAGNVGRAEELLDECPLDRRGWEWHFLKRQRYGNPPPMQHDTTAIRAAFSPDGRHLATATMDGTVTIRDSRTGQIVHELEHQTDFLGGALLRDMVYSPNGRYLAAARHDGKIRVWDPSSGQLLHTLEGHSGPTWQVAFSSDSRTIASGGSDRSVRLWDVISGQPLQVFSAHPSAVKGVAIRPDGRSVVVACNDGTVKVWDIETGNETFSFHDERLANPSSAWFSPDARRLAWSCLDGFIRIWDTTTGRLEINQLSNTHQCRAVAFSPDGTRIAVAGFDGTIRLLDGASGREMLTIFAHNSLVADVTFSPDGHRLASASYDHTVRIWDAAPLTSDPLAPHCVTLTGHKEKVSGIAFSSDGRWLASASWDHTIKLWELSNNGESRLSPPAGQSSAAGLGTISLRYTLRGHSGIVTGLDFSSDNRTLASSSLDNTFKLWDLQSPSGDSLTERLSVPVTQRARSIAFSSDGKLLALGQDNGIALYDPASGETVRPFKATPAPVPSLAFHPDRPLLISAGASDPAVKIWDLAAEKPSFEIRQTYNSNASVAVSPDGRRIASPGRGQAAGDYTVKVWDMDWDAKTYAEFRTLKGHRGYVWKVAFSPDGRYLASGSWDSTVKVWDLTAPESAEPVTLRGHAGFIQSLAFSPDGRRLASGSGYAGHGEIMVWDAALWENASREPQMVSTTPTSGGD
jgi:WD40 repeat protein/serine/threonine protein kinase